MFDEFSARQKYSLLVVLLLIILTLGVYWPVQNYDFISFDDSMYILENGYVQNGVTLEGFYWAFSTKYFGLWNPLVWISYMIDFEFFRFNAGGYHWTNVILHLFNTVLLFFLFRNLTGSIWRSAFVAALFAVHPINVESVAWVAERKNVLSTFFWMLTMLFYVWYVRQPGWKRYLPVFISFALGLMAKPMLVTLPFVLLLMDYWPLNRTAVNTQSEINIEAAPKTRKQRLHFLFLEKVPLFILSAIAIFMMFYSPFSTDHTQFQQTFNSVLMQRLYNAIFSYAMYLKKLFWPADLYIPYVYLNIPVWQIVLSAIILIIITILVCKYFKKNPYLPVGWFWYLGTLVPVIGIIQIGEQTMADRYAYGTFIGIFIIMAWGMEQISLKKNILKKLFIFASIAAIALLTVTTHHQLKLWNSTITLFQQTLKKDPKNYVAYAVLGQDMAAHGEYEKSLYYYDRALKLNSGLYVAYINKGTVLLKLGRRDEAIKVFEEAIQLDKFSFAAYFQIGFTYLMDNNLDQAIAYSLIAIQMKPDYAEAYNVLGAALFKKGKIQEGVLQFQKALRIDPKNKNARNNLQLALKKIRGERGIVSDDSH